MEFNKTNQGVGKPPPLLPKPHRPPPMPPRHQANLNERGALGRSGFLGAFYDVREEKFRDGSLFNFANLPDSCVRRRDVASSNVGYTGEDSYSERFEKLDINAELRASVFAGLLNLKGSGKYLTDHKTTSKSDKGTVFYQIRTKEEKININDEELKSYISLDGLESVSRTATHFVGGIVWGANTFATLEYRKSNVGDSSGISGDLERMVAGLKGSGDARYECFEENASCRCKIRVYGDVIPGEEELPETKKDAMALLRKTPTYVGKYNGGKGKPITFILYPLVDVIKMMKLESVTNVVVHAVDNESVLQIENIFNDLLVAKREFNDFYEEVTSPLAPHFSPTFVHDVCTYKNNLEISENKLRSKIREALILARSDPTQSSSLRSVMEHFSKAKLRPVKILKSVNNWKASGVREKLDFIEYIRANGANYLMSNQFGVDCVKNKEKNLYAMVFRDGDNLYSTDLWKNNYDLFRQLLDSKAGESKDFAFYVIEMVNQTSATGNDEKLVSIYHRVANVVESEDLLRTLAVKHSVPLARSSEFEFCGFRPNKSSIFKIRCPGSVDGKCCRIPIQWKCENDRCGANLYYGYDGFLYCNCGKAKTGSFSYRCTDNNHGIKWLTFQNADDLEFLMNEEINILVLGETGVGKSTFVNAFANYLTYFDLEEAECNELVSLIPTSFTVFDEDNTEKLIQFGEDANESQSKTGESATKSCRTYGFPFGNRFVRLFDTPGFGDTRGVERDVKNFQNILSYIANYPVLHGIVILLKPSDSKIDLMFRFSVRELLSHIHGSASKNIVFLFTNSRGTFYRPGDTLPSLRALLEDYERKTPGVRFKLNNSTVYSLDNESFRFLVAIKNGFTYPKDEKKHFVASWDRSVSECARLLDHLSDIKPHVINDTLSLNAGRELAMLLSQPLCDISQHIWTSIMNIEDQETKINQAGEDLSILKKELYVPVSNLTPVAFEHPRTVCLASKCVKIPSNSDWERVCHNPCELTIVTANIVKNSQLQNCRIMDSKCHCRVCGCSYDVHARIYYEAKEVIEIIDARGQEDVRNKEDLEKEKMRVLKECSERKAKLEREQRSITMASAKFSHFLKITAISPYNDALNDYLEHLLTIEKQNIVTEPDRQRFVDNLTKMKSAYEAQLTILEQNFNKVSAEITPSMINDIAKDLYYLQINGEFIKNAVEAEKEVRSKNVAMPNEKVLTQRPGLLRKMKNKLYYFFYPKV